LFSDKFQQNLCYHREFYSKLLYYISTWNNKHVLNLMIVSGGFKIITLHYYMASMTSGEMADCDWLRSTWPAVHYVKTNACILKQNSKTNWKFENYNLNLCRSLLWFK
jgi:hypothetical protein